MRDDKFFTVAVILLILMVIAPILVFGGIGLYRSFNPELFVNYGDEKYTFVLATVGSGRSETLYAGSMTLDDYQKWLDGENGTVFIYSPTKDNSGWRINLDTVTTICNYGSNPDFLPMNFS